jgi:hypothetical protein
LFALRKRRLAEAATAFRIAAGIGRMIEVKPLDRRCVDIAGFDKGGQGGLHHFSHY